tara:strand:+ start:1265 stop:1525 length:261 start_codon:yes stop_codon:yes gene_type:complete
VNKDLTGQEKEILVILMEECAELTQTCSKILRAGKKPDFMANFNQEIADVKVMMDLADSSGLITGDHHRLYQNKINNLRKWSDLRI